MIFDAKHEMIRKLVRQFAETELTTEVLDKVEETGEFPGRSWKRWPNAASWA